MIKKLFLNIAQSENCDNDDTTLERRDKAITGMEAIKILN